MSNDDHKLQTMRRELGVGGTVLLVGYIGLVGYVTYQGAKYLVRGGKDKGNIWEKK